MQGAEKFKRRKRRIRLKGGGQLRQGVNKADFRQSIACPCGHAQIHSRSIDLEAENHVKYTIVGILMDGLMIPLYQTNPHNNSIRKNVRGLAVMGMLLGLLHEFGLDLLSPGNLAKRVTAISKGQVRKDREVILLASGEGILSSHRPESCTDLERPPARSTARNKDELYGPKVSYGQLLWRTLASTRSNVNDLESRLQPRMRFRGSRATYRRYS